MAAVCGIKDDLLPTAALAAALASVEETQRLGGLEDDMEENAPRVSHADRGRSETSACIRGWAQLLENEALSDPVSNTAENFGIDFRLPYPIFSVLQTWSS